MLGRQISGTAQMEFQEEVSQFQHKNVYIFIHEKHEIGSTITNSMVSEVLPWKTGFKYINGTYDMNMSKVLPI